MVSVFLKAEIASERFGPLILELLEQHRSSRAIVDVPDLTSETENAVRRMLLSAYRAYVFEELPPHVAWHRVLLDREETARIRYIDYDYWNELSNQTRLARVAAESIKAGREVFGVSNQGFLHAAQALKQGVRFPELIVVGVSPATELTVIEGHVRLTAYMLAPECLPDPLEVVASFAPECARI